MNTQPEYKILVGEGTDVQKTLNQWWHLYDLQILHMAVDTFQVFLLVTRTPKETAE